MRIYLLENYPEEVIAVAFAKTSRSPEPFDVIAKELNEDKARKFHEKWVVGYGHSSVAEHAIVHLAAEGISRYAVDWIESARLASFTEKSTRYQIIDENSYYIPPTEHKEEYVRVMRALFKNYLSAFNSLKKYFFEQTGKEMKARVKALDRARFILPYATLANVGITMNARELAHTLRKMLSSGIPEVVEVAQKMREEAKKELPTLLRHAEATEYLKKIYAPLEQSQVTRSSFGARLIYYDKDAEKKVLASLLFKRTQLSYEDAVSKVANMTEQEKKELLDKYLSVGPFDIPPRELEHINYTFELTMDLGAYYEFKRHRIMTITKQLPTVKHGYYMPKEFNEVDIKDLFIESMELSENLYDLLLKEDKNLQGYAVTNAHLQRILVSTNLRELFHYIRLRGSPLAHFTIRNITYKMFDELKKVHPSLFSYIKPREF